MRVLDLVLVLLVLKCGQMANFPNCAIVTTSFNVSPCLQPTNHKQIRSSAQPLPIKIVQTGMLISSPKQRRRRDNEIERMHVTASTPHKTPRVLLKMHALIGRQFHNEIYHSNGGRGARPHRERVGDIYCTYSLGNGFITEVRRGESRDTQTTESWS
nr:PREDICTED: uncharacterized protein LOC103315188 isoform X1 [Tribolium castaneum]|eukprot:XP_015840497.1 PREDICTED: uncharacterized protein LOC103315188 isoform X1 [Tribolium castaneum]